MVWNEATNRLVEKRLLKTKFRTKEKKGEREKETKM